MTFSETDILVERDRGAKTGRVQEALTEAVSRVLLGGNGYASFEGLVRVVVPIPRVRPLDWLALQTGGPRFYWRARGGEGPEVAALGKADVYTGTRANELDALQERMSALLGAEARDARYYGGCAFDFDADRSEEWRGFPPLWFFLPRFEVHATTGGSRLVCNLILPRDRDLSTSILEAIAELDVAQTGGEVFEPLPTPISRRNIPERAYWLDAVARTVGLFTPGGLGKVVMARKAEFDFHDRLDPFALLQQLGSVTPACFHFLLEIERGTAFVGASPERLYRREGRAIESEAVAGTRPRGASAMDDERLREELLLSKKDRLEHAFVEQSIRDVLTELCERVEVDANASAMTLARGRHLYSGIHGVLREGVTDAEVLRGLHPTPAVGGYPTREALAVIREMEPFDRGWYAGPVGYLSADASEFAVAIRTGVVRPDSLTLFSGAGIVSGSEPAAEWEEIEHKIGDFTNVLGLDLERAK